jgi:hypothetical protein
MTAAAPAAENWGSTVEVLLFTAVAVVLYLVSDRLLDALERRVGRRFEYRSVFFFAILLVLALVTFSALQRLAGGD